MELDYPTLWNHVRVTSIFPLPTILLTKVRRAQPFGKISVGIFLLKLMGPNCFWRKWFIYVNLGLFTLMACLCVVFTYVQCNPPRALWEKIPDAKCWDPKSQSSFSIATTGKTQFDFPFQIWANGVK